VVLAVGRRRRLTRARLALDPRRRTNRHLPSDTSRRRRAELIGFCFRGRRSAFTERSASVHRHRALLDRVNQLVTQ
jgi:hypothetical protein